MSESLSRLLAEAALDVPAPDLASAAWTRGRARRRRARLASAAASTLTLSLIVGSAIIVSDRRSQPQPRTSLPTAAPATAAPGAGEQSPAESSSPQPPPSTALTDGLADVQTAPPPDTEESLPLSRSALPDLIVLGGKALPTLAEDPLDRAVALFQSGDDLGGGIVALGADGRFRSLDVPLGPRAGDYRGDAAKPASALTSTSLSPDGRAAAFPQKDELVVVDLTTGRPRRHRVPGFNEHVSWHPDGKTVLVSGIDAHFVNHATGRVTQCRTCGWGAVFTDAGDVAVVVFDGNRPRALLDRFNPVTGQRPGPTSLGDGITATTGSASTRGRWLAQLVYAENTTAQILLVDLQTGKVERRLDVSDSGGEGCCVPVGWIGSDTVVVQTGKRAEPARLLGWNIVTGAITRVAGLDGQVNVVSAPRMDPIGTALAPPPSPSASALRANGDVVLVAPSVEQEATLPFTASELPPSISIPADAAPLSVDNVSRALALLQTLTWDGDRLAGFETYVLGVDERVRRLDVPLINTRDEAGNGGPPLRSTSLRPDGRRAVFAQPDEVVVVDLTTGVARRHPVRGLNEGIRWLPDGERVVVTRTRSSVVLDTRTGAVSNDVPPAGLEDPANPGQLVGLEGAPLDNGGNATGPAELLRVDRETGARIGGSVPVDQRVDRVVGDAHLIGPDIAFGGILNLAGDTPPGLAQNPPGIAVVDAKTGALTRALAFGMDRDRFAGAVLGRSGDGRVIYKTIIGEKTRLLAWHPRTGAVTRLTEFSQPAALSLADLAG